MTPRSMSSVAIPTLRSDHFERARRGVKRWRYQSSSKLFTCPSIQPKQSATSSASS